MSRPATPQLRTAYDLQDVLRADFLDHRLAVAVEVGEWDPELLRGQARVMIKLGKGGVGEPSGHYQPGAWWPVRGSTTQIARPMLDLGQHYVLRIHAPAPSSGSDANSARGANEATDQLLRQTLAAIRRRLSAPFREVASVDWPEKIEGYPAFVHGSLAVVDIMIPSPILDDAVGLAHAVGSSTDITLKTGSTTVPVETFVAP